MQTTFVRRFSDEYDVFTDGKLIGRVRRDPHRMHLSASKTNWQYRAEGGLTWEGACETRKQAAYYLCLFSGKG